MSSRVEVISQPPTDSAGGTPGPARRVATGAETLYLLEGELTFQLENLLTMSSGLRYDESGFPWPFGDNVYTYYGVDLRQVALHRSEIERTPGQDWHYNNYNPLLLGVVLERATGTLVSQYMASELWQPLGAASAASSSLYSEGSGFEMMESGLNTTALDYARFGLLFLHGGEWHGERIVSRR